MESSGHQEHCEVLLDIVTALSTIGQAIKITKDLREIDRDLDAASYKAQMAELYGALADVKMALTDARENLHQKDQEIKKLNETITALRSGDICPICETGRMKVTASRPHPQFAFAGVQERTATCQNPSCNHTERQYYDPNKQN